MPTDSTSIIALSFVSGAGRATIHRAVRLATRAERPLAALFGLPVAELLRLAAPGEEHAASMVARCGEDELARARWVLGWAEECAMRHWALGESHYPAGIAETLGDQAPPILFYKGNEALVEARCAAIVGTRSPSLEGVSHARAAARLFSAQGVPVASGGARGIDQEAHHATLAADGTTIVVAPEGIHSFEASVPLSRGLAAGRVLLVSEFLPGAGWHTHQAMARNRTVAALAHLLCVIEPKPKGGTQYTAEQALASGRPVFYWGGACRDGALRHESGARPLLSRRNRIDEVALLAALENASHGEAQLEMF